MSNSILTDVFEVIRSYNVSRSIGTTTANHILSILTETTMRIKTNPAISPAACIGFAVLILATVLGNTLVLSALFLDKRLHLPSFFLIGNMAIADLLLGLSVLPFSSLLEILNDRWIFGQSFCSAWLALDVLCCTASIIGLMAVSIDRYIGVTRPLNYSSIMTTRRTMYLMIIVWAVSILTSVVPLFGLTDRKKKSGTTENFETCKVNKNTFYTIFSSMISFYIPVFILLILYSRVYQEAKKQGEKLESERRRLYQIDLQIASEHAAARQQQNNHSNGHSTKDRLPSNQTDDNKNEASAKLLTRESIPDAEYNLKSTDGGVQSKKDYIDHKNNPDDDMALTSKKNPARRSPRKSILSTLKHTSFHVTHDNHQIAPNDELLIIKRKIHNLKREKKAFRTVGVILGALLICWLPFFVTLPLISILKHHQIMKDENAENIWFKITFWLGYCNSALNPFVYAFSNRAIRRAFRQVIFRRFCGCICRKKPNQYNEQPVGRRQRAGNDSSTTDGSQIASIRKRSLSTDVARTVPKDENAADSPFRAPSTGDPVVSFADFLADTGDDDDKQLNQKNVTTTSVS